MSSLPPPFNPFPDHAATRLVRMVDFLTQHWNTPQSKKNTCEAKFLENRLDLIETYLGIPRALCWFKRFSSAVEIRRTDVVYPLLLCLRITRESECAYWRFPRGPLSLFHRANRNDAFCHFQATPVNTKNKTRHSIDKNAFYRSILYFMFKLD